MKYLDDPVLEALSQALSCVHLGDARVFGRVECYSCKNTDADHKLKQYIKKKFPEEHDHPNSNNPINQLHPNHSSSLPSPNQTRHHHHHQNNNQADYENKFMDVPKSKSFYHNNSNIIENNMINTNVPASFSSYSHSLSASYGIQIGSYNPTSTSFVLSPRSPFGPINQSSQTSRKTLFLLLATLNAAFPDYDFSDINPECFHKLPFLSVMTNQVNTTLFNQGNNNEELLSIIRSRVWVAIDEVIQIDDCDLYSFIPDPDVGPDAEEGNLWSFYYFFLNRRLKRMVFFTCRCVSAMAPMQPEERMGILSGTDATGRLLRDYTPSLDDDMSFEQYTMSNIEV